MGLFDFLNRKTNGKYMKSFSSGGMYFPSKKILVDSSNIKDLPPLASGINLISNTCAGVEFQLKKLDADGTIKTIKDHQILKLINEETNSLSGFQFKKNLVESVLISGGKYCVLDRKGVNIQKIIPLPSNATVQIEYLKDERGLSTGDAIINFSVDGKLTQSYTYDFLILGNSEDGLYLEGGLLKNNANAISNHLQSYKIAEQILEEGFNPRMLLTSDKDIKTDNLQELADFFMEQWYTNKEQVAFLPNGFKVEKPVNSSDYNSQMIEVKQQITEECERLLNIPAGMLSNGNNTKVLADKQGEFYSFTIKPILDLMVSCFQRDLLTNSMKKEGYFLTYDNGELLKGNAIEHMNYLEKAVKNGILSITEARYELNKDDFFDKDDDFLITSQGNVLLYKDKMINTNMLSEMGAENNEV